MEQIHLYMLFEASVIVCQSDVKLYQRCQNRNLKGLIKRGLVEHLAALAIYNVVCMGTFWRHPNICALWKYLNNKKKILPQTKLVIKLLQGTKYKMGPFFEKKEELRGIGVDQTVHVGTRFRSRTDSGASYQNCQTKQILATTLSTMHSKIV